MTSIVEINGARHVVWQCQSCGVFATVPEVVEERMRKAGGYRSCPNGHQWGWSKEQSEDEKIRRERDRLKQDQARLEEEKAATQLALEVARDRMRKAEVANKRLKKRASAGTCPCCSRTFSNMSEHMKKQHPEFVTESGAKVVRLKVARSS